MRNPSLSILLVAIFLVSCEKKNSEKPLVKKDSLTVVKDSSVKDSTTSANDSSGHTADSTALKDSATLAKDSLRVADSLAQHPMTYAQQQGKYIYAKYCATCHGDEGKADGFNTYNLDPKPRDFTEQNYLSQFSDERIFQIISAGGRGTNKSPSMPPYAWTLGKSQIGYVTAFVRTFAPPDSIKAK